MIRFTLGLFVLFISVSVWGAATKSFAVGPFTFSYSPDQYTFKKQTDKQELPGGILEHKQVPERAIRLIMMTISDKEWSQFKKTSPTDILKIIAGGVSAKNKPPTMSVIRKAGIFHYVFFDTANPSGRKFFMTLGYALKGRKLVYTMCGQDAQSSANGFLPIKQIDKVNNTKGCVALMENAK